MGPPADLRLSGVLAALSVATDLGMGQHPEKAVRFCLLETGGGVAVRAGLRLGLAGLHHRPVPRQCGRDLPDRVDCRGRHSSRPMPPAWVVVVAAVSLAAALGWLGGGRVTAVRPACSSFWQACRSRSTAGTRSTCCAAWRRRSAVPGGVHLGIRRKHLGPAGSQHRHHRTAPRWQRNQAAAGPHRASTSDARTPRSRLARLPRATPVRGTSPQRPRRADGCRGLKVIRSFSEAPNV